MNRIIAIVNQKGGVGKTTTAINLGAALARAGRRVLLVDVDPQANLTASLGVRAGDAPTLYRVLRGDASAREAIVPHGGYDLSGAEIEFAAAAGREFLLSEALAPVLPDYDYALLDCAPSLGLLTLGALTLAGEVFIPLQSEYLALQGVSQLLQTVQVVCRRLNPRLAVTGIVATLYDQRKRLNREVIENIASYFGAKLFSTRIRDNISLAEAPSYGQDIFEYRPDSYGAQDYAALAAEVIAQEVKP